ncbi:hypothetical protein MYU51_019687 [Penicillium brevicompactum]
MSGAAIATVKHTCWESYRQIGDKTMVAERRSRGLFKATAGECDELETSSCQYGINGDGLMNTIRTCSKFHEQDTPNIAVTRLRREPMPMRSHAVYPFQLNTRGIDDESVAAGRVLICVGIRTPRKNSLLVDQIPDVQWVILIILDLNLTSSDAWQLDRHRDELMFQSGSWRMSPLSPTSRLDHHSTSPPGHILQYTHQHLVHTIVHTLINVQQRSTTTVNDHQRSTTFNNDHQRPSTTINDHQRPSTTINVQQRSTTTINDHQRPSTFINDHQRSSTPINDHQRSSTPINDHQRPSTTIDDHRRPSTPVDLASAREPPSEGRLRTRNFEGGGRASPARGSGWSFARPHYTALQTF